MAKTIQLKPQLLHETAEIAFTEIKRYLEPRLVESLSLRRVTAPMYLPTDSPLLDGRYPGAIIRLPGANQTVEIVGSLDVWLRGQLSRYDIAPGFGVYTIMNALRTELPCNRVSSPHVAAWSWQQAVDTSDLTEKRLVAMAKTLHKLITDTEKQILALFPHMSPTLDKELRIAYETRLADLYPDHGEDRMLYEYLHPKRGGADSESPRSPVLLLVRDSAPLKVYGEIWVWNRILGKPVRIADLAAWNGDRVAAPSIGGNIFRGPLALQILQQDCLL